MFNEIAVLVLMHIVFTGRVAVGARRDDRLGPGVGDRVQQGVGIEGFVGDHSIGIDALQQGIGLRDVMRRPRARSWYIEAYMCGGREAG